MSVVTIRDQRTNLQTLQFCNLRCSTDPRPLSAFECRTDPNFPIPQFPNTAYTSIPLYLYTCTSSTPQFPNFLISYYPLYPYTLYPYTLYLYTLYLNRHADKGLIRPFSQRTSAWIFSAYSALNNALQEPTHFSMTRTRPMPDDQDQCSEMKYEVLHGEQFLAQRAQRELRRGSRRHLLSTFDIPCSAFDIHFNAGATTPMLLAGGYSDEEVVVDTPRNAECQIPNFECRIDTPIPLYPLYLYTSIPLYLYTCTSSTPKFPNFRISYYLLYPYTPIPLYLYTSRPNTATPISQFPNFLIS